MDMGFLKKCVMFAFVALSFNVKAIRLNDVLDAAIAEVNLCDAGDLLRWQDDDGDMCSQKDQLKRVLEALNSATTVLNKELDPRDPFRTSSFAAQCDWESNIINLLDVYSLLLVPVPEVKASVCAKILTVFIEISKIQCFFFRFSENTESVFVRVTEIIATLQDQARYTLLRAGVRPPLRFVFPEDLVVSAVFPRRDDPFGAGAAVRFDCYDDGGAV